MELVRNVQLIKRLLMTERNVRYQYVKQDKRYCLMQLVKFVLISNIQTGADWTVNSQLAARERSRPQ